MAKFRVTAPDGQTYDVDGPEGSTEQDAMAQVQSQVSARQSPARLDAMEAPNALERGVLKTMNFLNPTRRGNIITPEEESFIRGTLRTAAKPAVGAAQLASHAMLTDDAANAVDRFVVADEKSYQDERKAAGRTGFDASTLTGAALSMPVVAAAKYIPQATTWARGAWLGAGTGAGLELTNPVTAKEDESYTRAKVHQGTEGAIGGALAAGIGIPVLQLAAKGVGAAVDMVRGRLGDVQAAKVLRAILGEEEDVARRAWAAAPDNITAAQAAGADIQGNTLAALGGLVERKDKSAYFQNLRLAQLAENQDRVAAVAGGISQTQANLTRNLDRKALGAQFAANKNVDLSRANHGDEILGLERSALAYDDAAAGAVQDVRRFTAAGERAENMGTELGRRNPATAMGDVTGMPSASKRYSYGQELADRAEGVATQRAADSLQFGELRDLSAGTVQAIRRQFRPLDHQPILQKTASLIDEASHAGNTQREAVLSAFGEEVERWAAKNGGQLDAFALAGLRTNAINNSIQRIMGTAADPKAVAAMTAKAEGELKPIIDRAIVEAGGTGWPNTLKIFEKGMLQNNRKKMGAELLKGMDTEAFDVMMAGNNPKAVSKIFGKGNETIARPDGTTTVRAKDNIDDMMGGKMRDLNLVRDYRDRERILRAKAEGTKDTVGGNEALADILNEARVTARLPGLISKYITIANKGLDVAERNLDKKVVEAFVTGMKTGKSANQLIDMMPTSKQRNALAAILENNGFGKELSLGQYALSQ